MNNTVPLRETRYFICHFTGGRRKYLIEEASITRARDSLLLFNSKSSSIHLLAQLLFFFPRHTVIELSRADNINHSFSHHGLSMRPRSALSSSLPSPRISHLLCQRRAFNILAWYQKNAKTPAQLKLYVSMISAPVISLDGVRSSSSFFLLPSLFFLPTSFFLPPFSMSHYRVLLSPSPAMPDVQQGRTGAWLLVGMGSA